MIPAGGHAIDVLTQDIELRPATGQEIFIPFGESPDATPEHPNPGEIVFVEGNTVLTRRWVWRQSNHTLTLPTTTAIELNIDGLPPVTQAKVEEICQEAMELIKRFCGGRMWYEVITQQNPRIRLTALKQKEAVSNPSKPWNAAPAGFISLVRSTEGGRRLRLMIDSLRAFGGPLSQCPIWVFWGSGYHPAELMGEYTEKSAVAWFRLDGRG